jgi:adenylate cyclase
MDNKESIADSTQRAFPRKLAAIFSTDVAGYSRLMGDDEEATIRTLTAYRELISSLIQQHRGRVVDAPGDNLLAEFASVVDAVRSAVEIQQALKGKNAELPEQRRMQFRIGINLGDVIVEGERLYGDGVNIAARLESLAIPGGICISGTVYDQVKNKAALGYEYLGEREVKNIAEPVRVYRIAAEVPSPPVEQASSLHAARMAAPPEGRAGNARRKGIIVAAVSLLLITGAIVAIRALFLPIPNPQSPAPSTQAAPAALPLPDKPSLIVLPFVNMSKDPDQEYFSDGLTETLTGALSKISSLFVIARNSAFTYKGKAVKVQDVSKEMGVRYVLEGSVQRADQRVRITVQLIEATTGYHLWSEQYDRPLKDIFALQDEIVQRIVTTLKLQLTLQEQGYSARKRTNNPEAYDYFLRGMEFYWRSTQEAHVQAQHLFEKAIELDPQYAEAYVQLGWIAFMEWALQWSSDSQTLERAHALGQKAVTLDGSLPTAHILLSFVYRWRDRQHERAIAESERAIALDPNNAEGYFGLGFALGFAGRTAEAISTLEKAMRLNPQYPANYIVALGFAYQMAGQYVEGIAVYKRALTRNPDILFVHANLAIIYSELNREEEARAEVAEIQRLSPGYSLEGYKQRWPIKDPTILERYVAALRKAGLK